MIDYIKPFEKLNNNGYIKGKEILLRFVPKIKNDLMLLQSEESQTWFNRVNIDFYNYIFILFKNKNYLLPLKDYSYNPNYYKSFSKPLGEVLKNIKNKPLGIVAIYNTIYEPESDNIIETYIDYYDLSNVDMENLISEVI